MKRVRNFVVVTNAASGIELERKVPDSLRADAGLKHIQGWHPAWDEAMSLLASPMNREVAIVDDNGSWNVIALFCRRNLETAETTAKQKTKWKSASIKTAEDFWCNLNYSDYGWDWVGGAKREVPFRLKYLERQAEANPDGLVSRAYAWASEVRDIVLGPRKKIS